MKKYIRIKNDRIIRITEKGCIKEFDNKLYAFRDSSFSYRFENGDEVVKQADTIEELCDEFVIVKDSKGIKFWKNFKLLKEYDHHIVENDFDNIYGAIWTTNGLKYVAKMNEKGEFELL